MAIRTKKVTNQADWHKLIQNFRHDVFHTYEFNSSYALEINAEPILFLFYSDKNELLGVLPLLQRKIPNSNDFDLTSCYGYSGILSSNDNYGKILSYLEADFGKHFPEYVTIFLRSNPFVRDSNNGSDVIYIDVASQNTDILKTYRHGHRSEISKSLLHVTVEEAPLESTNIDIFFDIYSSTMARLNASKSHLFSKRFFETLCSQEYLGLKLIFVYHEGRPIAGCIFLWNDFIGHYFLSGSVAKFDWLRPGKLLIYKCNEIAKTLKVETLSLGGGLGGSNDTLSQFKRGFSKTVKKYNTYCIVSNASAYAKLLEEGESLPESTFFPRYRSS